MRRYILFSVSVLLITIGLKAFIHFNEQWWGGVFVAGVIWGIIGIVDYMKMEKS